MIFLFIRGKFRANNSSERRRTEHRATKRITSLRLCCLVYTHTHTQTYTRSLARSHARTHEARYSPPQIHLKIELNFFSFLCFAMPLAFFFCFTFNTGFPVFFIYILFTEILLNFIHFSHENNIFGNFILLFCTLIHFR